MEGKKYSRMRTIYVVGWMVAICGCAQPEDTSDVGYLPETDTADHSDLADPGNPDTTPFECADPVRTNTEAELVSQMSGSWPNTYVFSGRRIEVTGDVSVEREMFVESSDFDTPVECDREPANCLVQFVINEGVSGVEVTKTQNVSSDSISGVLITGVKLAPGTYRFVRTRVSEDPYTIFVLRIHQACKGDCSENFRQCRNRICLDFVTVPVAYCDYCLDKNMNICACWEKPEGEGCRYRDPENDKDTPIEYGTCKSGSCSKS